MTNSRLLGVLLPLLICVFPIYAADVTQDAPFVWLKTSEYSLRVAPQWAWTPDTIAFRDKVLAEPSGLYGLVFDLGEGKFVGSGHREGGREDVLDVQIEADGKAMKFLGGETISGDKIVFTKQSKIAGLRLKSVLRIGANGIEGEQFVHVDKDFHVDRMYGFMFPWLSSTTQWIGETIDGKVLDGQFENKGFIVNEKLRWCAVYEPNLQMAAITYFPPNDEEQNFLHFFNDDKAYHKQYFRVMGERDLKAGEEFHYSMKLLAVAAKADEWKSKARQAAEAIR